MSESSKIDYIQERVESVATTVASIDKDIALQRMALEEHNSELKRMNDILQQNVDSLKEHMQNNILLKEMIVHMDKRLEPIEIDFIQKAAVRDYVYKNAKFLAKIGTALSVIGGIIWSVLKFLGHA
jgi:predicted RNase H-like nuclease (RuvC/YqgF family)